MNDNRCGGCGSCQHVSVTPRQQPSVDAPAHTSSLHCKFSFQLLGFLRLSSICFPWAVIGRKLACSMTTLCSRVMHSALASQCLSLVFRTNASLIVHAKSTVHRVGVDQYEHFFSCSNVVRQDQVTNVIIRNIFRMSSC